MRTTGISAVESDLSSCVRALAREAREARGVPNDVVTIAERATRSGLAELAGRALSGAERARAAAYFWTVVRNRVTRRCAARAYSKAIVRESVARDLRDAGWDAGAVALEVERVCG